MLNSLLYLFIHLLPSRTELQGKHSQRVRAGSHTLLRTCQGAGANPAESPCGELAPGSKSRRRKRSSDDHGALPGSLSRPADPVTVNRRRGPGQRPPRPQQRQKRVSRPRRPGAHAGLRGLQPPSLGAFQQPEPGGLHEPASALLLGSCSAGRGPAARAQPRRTSPAPPPSMLGAGPSPRALSAPPGASPPHHGGRQPRETRLPPGAGGRGGQPLGGCMWL